MRGVFLSDRFSRRVLLYFDHFGRDLVLIIQYKTSKNVYSVVHIFFTFEHSTPENHVALPQKVKKKLTKRFEQTIVQSDWLRTQSLLLTPTNRLIEV